MGNHDLRSYQTTTANKLETLTAVTEGVGAEDMHQLELTYFMMSGRSDEISHARHRLQATCGLSPVFLAPKIESFDEDVLAGQP